MNSRVVGLLALAFGVANAVPQDTSKLRLEPELPKALEALGSGERPARKPLSVGADEAVEKKEQAPAKKQKGPTEITADNGELIQKSNRAIFTGNVIVIDPEFTLKCDKLTALLKKEGEPTAAVEKPKPMVKPAGAPPAPAPASRKEPAETKKPAGQGGLEKAIAESSGKNRVFITQQKLDADGKVSTTLAYANKAEYDAVTGEITLSGRPEVRQGVNSSIAENDSTVMILTREGEMRTVGRAKVRLQDTSSAEKPRSAL